MKKTLYIGGFCMPDGNAAAQRVLGVAKLMRLCDFDVRFCGLSRQIKTGPENGAIDGFEYRNYPYPTSFGDWWRYLTGQDQSIQEIKSYKPEIVILYNHPALAIERIAKYCKKKGIKVIADITEWYEPSGNPFFRAIKGYDTKRRMTRSHLKLDGLICISSYLTQYYRNQGLKVLELPPLVDLQQSKWHQATENPTDELRVIYAGSPGARKDRLDLILKALDNIIPNANGKIRFDIVGITEEQYSRTWGDEKRRSYVTFHGRRPHPEVIKLLLSADFQIFLRPDTLPNRAGFPTKFVESVSSETLPITNLSSNLNQYLRDGQNGFILFSLEQNAIESTLEQALRLSKSQLEKMKRSIDVTKFDFHTYLSPFKEFANNL